MTHEALAGHWAPLLNSTMFGCKSLAKTTGPILIDFVYVCVYGEVKSLHFYVLATIFKKF